MAKNKYSKQSRTHDGFEVPMDRNYWFRWIRLLGMGMLLVGLFVPWFQLGLEPHPTPLQWSGLEDILNSGSLGAESMLKDGPDLYSTTLLLEGLSGIGLILYFFYSVSSVKKVRKGSKVLSLFFVGISIVFISNSQAPIVGRILFGFWLFMLGLLLFAIVEWLSSADFAERKGEPN